LHLPGIDESSETSEATVGRSCFAGHKSMPMDSRRRIAARNRGRWRIDVHVFYFTLAFLGTIFRIHPPGALVRQWARITQRRLTLSPKFRAQGAQSVPLLMPIAITVDLPVLARLPAAQAAIVSD